MAPGQCAKDLRLQSGDRMRDSDDSDGSTDDDPATPPPVHAVASNQLSLGEAGCIAGGWLSV